MRRITSKFKLHYCKYELIKYVLINYCLLHQKFVAHFFFYLFTYQSIMQYHINISFLEIFLFNRKYSEQIHPYHIKRAMFSQLRYCICTRAIVLLDSIGAFAFKHWPLIIIDNILLADLLKKLQNLRKNCRYLNSRTVITTLLPIWGSHTQHYSASSDAAHAPPRTTEDGQRLQERTWTQNPPRFTGSYAATNSTFLSHHSQLISLKKF